jgi:opacity protein-like surface antigen
MKSLLMAALSATAICGFAAAMPAAAQETVTGAPKGTAPATTEGYGPSSVIVCNEGGYCWHSLERYDYPPTASVVVHPYDWRWNEGDRFAWREHKGRGYWRGDDWEAF